MLVQIPPITLLLFILKFYSSSAMQVPALRWGPNVEVWLMWREIFRLAAATELGLVAAEQSFHPGWLPLAGGHVQQIAVLFILAFVALESFEFVRALWRKRP